MIEPEIIDPTMMKSSGDCWACCLRMLLGVSYPEILWAAPNRRNPLRNGLKTGQVINVAKKLGYTLRLRRGGPEDDETGILDLLRKDDSDGHMVMWLQGIIYNPADGLIYTDPESFFEQGNWRVDGFIWRES